MLKYLLSTVSLMVSFMAVSSIEASTTQQQKEKAQAKAKAEAQELVNICTQLFPDMVNKALCIQAEAQNMAKPGHKLDKEKLKQQVAIQRQKVEQQRLKDQEQRKAEELAKRKREEDTYVDMGSFSE
jgi:hypothetical protein